MQVLTKQSKHVAARILFDIVLIFCIFIAPWWIPLIAAVIILVRYNAYEVLLAGLVMDALYGAPIAGWYGIEFIFTLLLLVLVVSWYLLSPYLIS